MNSGSMGGRERTSIAGKLNYRPSAGFTTPNTRTGAGSSGSGGRGGRHGFIPRMGSDKKLGPSVLDSAGPCGLPTARGQRPSTDNARGRLSVPGGAGRMSLARTTPSRNPLINVANLLQPSSAQLQRLSTESRQSTAGRRKKREVRPITDASFKKFCVDNILNMLMENGYNDYQQNTLSRKTITHPTTKAFTSIFSFIYSKLDMNYKLPARFDEEIPRILKQLQYPATLPKSTFVTVGSPHSWPTLLAMLSWLCDLVTEVMSTELVTMAFPSDFENPASCWDDLNLFMDIGGYDEDQQIDYLKQQTELSEQELGVDDRSLEALLQEMTALGQQEQLLLQEEGSLAQDRQLNAEMKSDLQKLDDYNNNMKLKISKLPDQIRLLEQEKKAREQSNEQLRDTVARLTALKASQSFSANELLAIKNHSHTSAATLQQLQQLGKQTQEKIWEVEVQLTRSQVNISDRIQQYNSSESASVVGSIGQSHSADTPLSAAGLAARLTKDDITHLKNKLKEHRRFQRDRLMENNNTKSKADDEYRQWHEQVEEKKHHGLQTTTRITNMEEEIVCNKQENEKEEAALQQQLTRLQAEVSAIRRAPKCDLFTKRQHIVMLQDQLQAKTEECIKTCTEGTSNVRRMKLKVDEQLEWEKKQALILREKFANILPAVSNQ